VVAGGLAITVTERQVVALDLSTHAPRWTVLRTPGFLDTPAVDASTGSNGIVVFTEGRSGASVALAAVDLSTGTRLWRFAPAGGAAGSGASVGASPSPGSSASASPSPAGTTSASPSPNPSPTNTATVQAAIRGAPVIADGMVFAGDDDGVVYALNLATGARIWSFQAGAPVHTSPAVANGQVWALAENGSTGRVTLFALDEHTGKQRWSYSPGSIALHVSPPTVVDGVVYVGFGDRTLRAFDATTHELAWSGPVRFPFSSSNGLAAGGGSVYALDAAGGLYRFDSSNGDLTWDFQFAANALRGAPLITQGYAYAQLDDGTVAAVNISTGNQAWSTRLRLGAAGGAAPAGDTILVSYVGRGGGIVAFAHVDGPLTSIESPTKLHPLLAVANFGVAFVIMLVGIVAIFTLLTRRRARTASSVDDGLDGQGDRP
jgi:outer membrane protein assembly factor BamB